MIRDTLKLPLRLAALAAMVGARSVARRLGRALDVPYGATILRPSVTRWAVERAPAGTWPGRWTIYHDDLGELSGADVYEPLRWGPVVLVVLVEYEGFGDVWVLRASSEVRTAAGVDALKDWRGMAETMLRDRWDEETSGEGL